MRAITRLLLFSGIMLSAFLVSARPTFALFDPLSVSNNHFGIHIIEPAEVDLASQLVNSAGGDWGYVVVVIRDNDRNTAKWQHFFNEAREKHIIPIVRLATHTQEDYWVKPSANEAVEWANFLSSLHWPVNNHYIVVYNEPNHAKEWGNTVDPASYAHELEKTISTIKGKDPNAFIINAGFDASAPSKPDQYMDEELYLDLMNQAVPGIFGKLDGWASHSYPQPDFTGDPSQTGRGTITTYRWEQDVLKQKYTIAKLPVFITETGWAHNEGSNPSTQYLAQETAANYFATAFSSVWTDPNLVAVTPFTLVYAQQPFDHFAWIKTFAYAPGNPDNGPPQALAQYSEVQSLTKQAGKPVQITQAKLIRRRLPQHIATNMLISGRLTLENQGETVWFPKDRSHTLSLEVTHGKETTPLPLFSKSPIQPGERYVVKFDFLSPPKADYQTYTIAIKDGDQTLLRFPYTLVVTTTEPKLSMKDKVIDFFQQTLESIKDHFS